jgi:hypothetical protein
MEKTSGDVIRINITPPSDTFPWVRFFVHEHGIKKSGKDVGSIDAKKQKSREELSREIGEGHLYFESIIIVA